MGGTQQKRPASEVILPPSKAATTAPPAIGAIPNRSALHSVCVGLPVPETNHSCNTIFSDLPAPSTYPYEKCWLALLRFDQGVESKLRRQVGVAEAGGETTLGAPISSLAIWTRKSPGATTASVAWEFGKYRPPFSRRPMCECWPLIRRAQRSGDNATHCRFALHPNRPEIAARGAGCDIALVEQRDREPSAGEPVSDGRTDRPAAYNDRVKAITRPPLAAPTPVAVARRQLASHNPDRGIDRRTDGRSRRIDGTDRSNSRSTVEDGGLAFQNLCRRHSRVVLRRPDRDRHWAYVRDSWG
jgi:hypothetical protein